MAAITVADCRATFGSLVSDSANFIPYLNQVSERYIESGLYEGLFSIVDFDAAVGYISLPRAYETLLGCTIHTIPFPIFGGFHEFLENGPGYLQNLEFDWSLLVDEGQFPTLIRQTTPLLIRATPANPADAGKKIRFFGYNTSGIISDPATGVTGVEVTLGAGPVTTSQAMILTAANKEVTVGNVTIASVDGATVTTLSTWEPQDTNPQYRRYKCGAIQPATNGFPAIRTKCKRRWIRLVNESDQVYPPNLGALKMGIMAMNFESSSAANEVAAAETFWNKGAVLLSQQLRHIRGAARFPINIPQNNEGSFNAT